MVKYIPEQGDIVALSFDPQSGHEQKGRRPAIIISNKILPIFWADIFFHNIQGIDICSIFVKAQALLHN